MLTFNESFRLTLRKERRAAGLTQQQMADHLHISRPTYTYYETGKTQPSLENLVKIAAILQIPIASLLPETANQ